MCSTDFQYKGKNGLHRDVEHFGIHYSSKAFLFLFFKLQHREQQKIQKDVEQWIGDADNIKRQKYGKLDREL